MLITVKKPKLVLGRTVYLRGDVFECRDAEAKLFVAGGLATRSPAGAKATKASPTPPTTGMSVKAGTSKASPQTLVPNVGRGRRAPAPPSSPRAPATEPAANAASAPTAPAPTAPAPTAARPVGAMTMPQSGPAPKV